MKNLMDKIDNDSCKKNKMVNQIERCRMDLQKDPATKLSKN